MTQQTISVTRYLNPGGGTRWCLIDAGIRVQSRVDHNAINKIIDDDGNGVDATEALVKCWGSGIKLSQTVAANFPLSFKVKRFTAWTEVQQEAKVFAEYPDNRQDPLSRLHPAK